MSRNRGMTLVELLIALVVLAVVVSIATSGIVSSLRVQSVQQAATESQARLRRVVEVVTQELRSAVLGAVTNDPYVSGSAAVSFSLLDGGAGYPVLPHDSGNNDSFKRSANVQITSDDSARALEGSQVLMVNGANQGVLFRVTNVTARGGASQREYNLVHAGCANTIDYTPGSTLIFAVKTTGIRFDAGTRTLFQAQDDGVEVPLSFELDDVRLEYIYEESDGTMRVLDAPILSDAGVPQRSGTLDVDGVPVPVTLVRIHLVADASEPAAGGRTVARTYTGQIELVDNQSFQVREVVACDR